MEVIDIRPYLLDLLENVIMVPLRRSALIVTKKTTTFVVLYSYIEGNILHTELQSNVYSAVAATYLKRTANNTSFSSE